MKLLKLSSNAHSIETPAGAILFSYENMAAARLGSRCFRIPGTITTATWAHMKRFAPVLCFYVVVSPEEFNRVVRQVLAATETPAYRGPYRAPYKGEKSGK